MHGEMWNLVLTFDNINAPKSDKLLKYDTSLYLFVISMYKRFI